MGTWIKETDQALYLMQGNGYLDSVLKRPSPSNPKEQIANVSPLKGWFARSDRPRGMTVAVGTGAPEPEPVAPAPGPGDEALAIAFNGQLHVVADTFFKTSTQPSSQLGDRDKVLVRQGTILPIRYYSEASANHWLVDLQAPSLGSGDRTLWYVYIPHMRLGTDDTLTVTYDTLFKLAPQPSTTLPDAAKVFVSQGHQFRLASFLPAAANHTQIELADATLGPNNGSLWYVYNRHAKTQDNGSIPHQGLQVETVRDTVFTLSPQPPQDLPEDQKVQVKAGEILPIQYYLDHSTHQWLIELVAPSLGDGKATSWYINTLDTKLVSDVTLTVTSPTIFKKSPQPAAALPDSAKVSVATGSQFTLISHLPAAGNHTRIELADTHLGPNQDSVWYVYNPHVTIQGQRQLLQVLSDTVFKTSTAQSSQLPAEEKVLVRRNTIFELSSYAQPASNHVKVALKGAFLGPQNRNTWYCFLPDIYVVGTEIGNNPNDQNNGGSGGGGDRGIPLQFPGFSGTYYANDPIFWQTQYGDRGNFTWGEALHVNPTTGQYRRPANADVIYGIQRIARAMEDIRKRYGDRPITVTSWYRDPATNAAVGGSPNSRHLFGDAVDFVVPGRHPFDVYADLDAWWGSRGGLASARSFTHIDARGYRARWDYGDRFVAMATQAPLSSTTGTWMKATDLAIYLMRGNTWISRLTKTPSAANPQEQVLNITGMAAWFERPDYPTAMTFAMGTGAPEPDPWVPSHSGKTNPAGIALIKHFEGLRLTAYQDPVGIWTIGYGHTSMAGPPPVVEGMTITAAEAEAILKQDLDLFERGVADALTIITNDDQFSAMVSFAFNVGLGAFRNSTLLRKHNAGDFAGAADEFPRWIYADGQILPGLVRRRQAERALYLGQNWGP